MYRLLEQGEFMTFCDEFYSLLNNAWRPVPDQWVGKVVDYTTDISFSRNNIPVRRKINEETVCICKYTTTRNGYKDRHTHPKCKAHREKDEK